jgi:isoleucyl-tRNA synthetase
MDYKQTLNLPKTDFPMRASLAEREPKVLERWRQEGLYNRLLERNANGVPYVLHDGPPYANGDVHLGTALNKIVKDVIVKRHLMAGRYAPYVPGWDCHGMPIEHQVLRKLGSKARSMPQLEIRRLCREFADKYFNIQREQFQRLGVLGDWENPYLTMSPEYEAGIVRTFRKLVEGDYIYRGLRPVHWCPTCGTALAEAEVEYADHHSPSIYVRFRFRGSREQAAAMAREPADAPALAAAGERLSAVIWTTTPWTLPANLAVCLNPHLDYVAIEVAGEYLIVAHRLADTVLEAVGLSADAARKIPVDLSALDGADAFQHPFIDRPSRLIFGSHVTADVGTGCVHTAPGHGYDDFQVGQQYGIDVLTPVDAQGRFTSEGGPYEGRAVFDTNDDIVAQLRTMGALLHTETHSHQYPHCWRCKNPLIFRATEQWFLRIDQSELRQAALREIDRVRWVPKWGRDRIYHMMETRPDWCLSRQRAWGVPIPAFRCESCGVHHADAELVRHVEALFAEHGSDVWYELPAAELMPPGYVCTCGGTSFVPDENILDVWFDSGCSHAAVLEPRNLGVPADLYVEAVDQHRGWFQVSLITAVATRGEAPYRSVLTHGLILDAGKKKMSKSLGNAIAPEEIVSKYGADVLRLLFASVDFTNDTAFSQDLVKPLLETYRRIRNTCRFLLGNLEGFDPVRHAVPESEMPEMDRWILQRGRTLLERSLAAYDTFAFHQVVQGVVTFCAVDLSSLYLDIAKDRLYCSAAADVDRRAGQTVCWRLADLLARTVAPILSFTADEIWSYLPGDRAPTVFEAGFPQADEVALPQDLVAVWDRLLAVRSVVMKSLEDARQSGQIGHPLDARVILNAGGATHALLQERAKNLPSFFIVSQVELRESADAETTTASVEAARGSKCARCWNFAETVGDDAEHPELCDRCVGVLAANG